MTLMPQGGQIRRRLRNVRLVALIDLVLLVALVASALTGQKELVHVLGPLHGINFLLLLVLVGTAALDGVWGWWYPLAVLLTAGPLGAFLGEVVIARRLRAQNATVRDDSSLEPGGVMTDDSSGVLLSLAQTRLLDKQDE
jgi:hypothetical protein